MDGTSGGIDFLQETVTPVIDALNQIRRPYGFRVDKAMKLYVANYPGGRHKDAVADQIEMKLLPKLNGVELQDGRFEEVKKAMANAINKTEDKQLANAFEQACSQNDMFFKWRGVMR